MALTREMLAQIAHVVRPLSVRIANASGRAVVQLVDDTGKLQVLQIGVLAGETIDNAEHVQPYGFTSVPLAGADTAVVIFPNGDRSHPLVVAVADRRYRPAGGQPGEVTVYNNTGAKIVITKDGDIVATAAPGRRMLIDDGSGAAELPTMADFNGIVSIMNSAGTGAGTALPAAVTAYQAAHPTWPEGTAVLKAK